MKENNISDKIKRVEEKIEELQESLDFLIENVPKEFEDYTNNLKTKAVCEHYFEKVVEMCIDLAFLIIKLNDFKIPKDDENSFTILTQNSILSKDLADRLKEAKGMRNIIAHEYGEVDDAKVYFSLNEEIERDINGFIDSIERHLKLK